MQMQCLDVAFSWQHMSYEIVMHLAAKNLNQVLKMCDL